MDNMESAAARIDAAMTRYKVGLAAIGIASAVIGLIILLQPGLLMKVVVLIISVWAIGVGAIQLSGGIFNKEASTWSRSGRIIVGLIFAVGGVVALYYSNQTGAALTVVVGLLMGILWISDGIMTLMLTTRSGGLPIWALVYSVIAIGAGVLLLFNPMFSETLIRWMLAIAFIVVGLAQVVRAIQVGKSKPPIVEVVQ